MEHHSSSGTIADVTGEKEISGLEKGLIAENADTEDPLGAAEEWEGYEVERVADDDAAEYEDEQPGIKIKYTLSQDDFYQCFKSMKIFKTSGIRAVIETIILIVCAIPSLMAWFSGNAIQTQNVSVLLLPIICALLIVAIWLVPYFTLKRRAKNLADGKIITAEIFPDVIHIGEGEGSWEIPLDGTSYYEEFENLMVITTPQSRVTAFPIREIEPSALPEIQAIIVAGTMPKPKKDKRRGK